MTAADTGKTDSLLDDLVRRVAAVRYAVVLSTDGLLLAHSQSIATDDAEHFCAISAAIYSLAHSAGRRFDSGGMRQAVVEFDDGLLFVTAAGANACLALFTADVAEMGVIAYEMSNTVDQIGSTLSIAPRRIPVAQAD